MSLPAEMRVVEISEPGGPEVLRPATRRVPRAGGRRNPDPGARRRRQPAGRAAARRRLSAAAGRLRPARARGRRRGRRRRPGRLALARGRRRLRAAAGRRLRRIRADATRPTRCRSRAGLGMVAGRGALPETFFTVWTNVFGRGRLARRRDPARAWRLLGHRHHGDPARPARRAPACSPPPAPRRSAAPAATLGAELAINYREADFVAAVREATGGRGRRRDPRHGRRRLPARDVRGAGAGRPAGDDRPPAGPKVELNFAQVMMKRLTHHRLDPATAVGRGQGADRRRPAPRGLAAARGRPDRAGDRPHLPAGRGRRGPRADGDARRISARSCWRWPEATRCPRAGRRRRISCEPAAASPRWRRAAARRAGGSRRR